MRRGLRGGVACRNRPTEPCSCPGGQRRPRRPARDGLGRNESGRERPVTGAGLQGHETRLSFAKLKRNSEFSSVSFVPMGSLAGDEE